MGRKERAQHYLPRLFGYGWCDSGKYQLTTPHPLETRINTGLKYGGAIRAKSTGLPQTIWGNRRSAAGGLLVLKI